MKTKMKTKIFHVCPNFLPVYGGIESFVYESSKELAKRGYDVTVVTGDKIPKKNAALPARQEIDGIHVRRFPFRKFSRYNTSVEALKFIVESNFDILHIHGLGFFSDAIPIIKLSGAGKKVDKKVVLSTHGGIFHTRAMMPLKRLYFNTMTRIAARYADKIIAVSRQDMDFMKKIADRKKLIHIGNGIYWRKFSRIKRAGNGKTLIFVGRLAKSKRIDRALYALSEVKKSIPSVRMFVIGEDWGERRNLQALARRLGLEKNVIFTGSISDVKLSHYLSKSDVFLLPSEYEGFGISAVVAMASGLPVIGSDIDAMREIITDGKNGFLLDYADSKKVAGTILSLIESKKARLRIGRNARIYSKRYDWPKIVRSLDKVYQRLQ